MRLTVFGRELCTGCESTKAALRVAGIPFTYHDLDVPTLQSMSDMAWFDLAVEGLTLPVLVVEHEDASFRRWIGKSLMTIEDVTNFVKEAQCRA